MNASPELGQSMTGSILVATPALLDPNFRRTILLLSHHTREEGAVGIVLNRPMGMTFGEITSGEKVVPELEGVPMFYGGPVGALQPVLIGLRWEESGLNFHNFSGGNTREIPPEWKDALRIVVGHSGWTAGQLESEIEQKSWFVLPPSRDLIEMNPPELAWRSLLRRMNPMLKLLAEAPEDPFLN